MSHIPEESHVRSVVPLVSKLVSTSRPYIAFLLLQLNLHVHTEQRLSFVNPTDHPHRSLSHPPLPGCACLVENLVWSMLRGLSRLYLLSLPPLCSPLPRVLQTLRLSREVRSAEDQFDNGLSHLINTLRTLTMARRLTRNSRNPCPCTALARSF